MKHVHEASKMPNNGGSVWPGSDEVLGTRTELSRPLGLRRIGVHLDVLAPGQRSSLPHAEDFEEECVYVLSGSPDCRVDGVVEAMKPGSFVAYPPATGVEHCVVNNSAENVQLIVIGERRDHGCVAAQRLQRLWRKVDPELIATTFTADAVYDDAMTGRTASGHNEIEQLLAEREARSVELGHWAIGWSEGFFEWSSANERGVVAMKLRVAESQMLQGVVEYATTGVR
ncbi:MAG: cupin domain-containing protein [Gammaproteobacteria bacterium]|nr:cupin domain-containing protein [Gammaproteobacteria bacterium]